MCIARLQQVIWKNGPVCPYCKGLRSTAERNSARRHCNVCHVSYSLTVRTVFQGTRVPLRKWFQAIALMLGSGRASCREVSRVLDIDKNTACYMNMRLRKAMLTQHAFLKELIQWNERS
jgi:transposase-like protein